VTDPETFIATHTEPGRAPLVPEFELALATEITPIWLATEDWLARTGIEPPFWAFAWPGSQALARHFLDHPETVAGKRVLDFAAGCGLAALAALSAGARSAEAADIDPLAQAATRLNAARNHLALTVSGDLVGSPCRWDLIVCGDVCYEKPMTTHILPWLRTLARTAEVWIADPGRAYLPHTGMTEFTHTTVPTTTELEDTPSRTVRLFRLQSA
jgi:predicted nicotinamide N-methyase